MKKTFLFCLLSFLGGNTFAQLETFYWDTINFEEPYQYLQLDESGQSCWQIGQPQKVYFDSAFSPSRAIVTDTINSYPASDLSFFDLKIGDFNYPNWYPWSIWMEIKHKYDTDTLCDGGYISVSYDNGEHFMNIIHDTVYYGGVIPAGENENLYGSDGTLCNGEPGFSGRSDGWISTWFSWHYLLVKSQEEIGDTMVIRFNFVSDDMDTAKEGWMIDNIKLYTVELAGGIRNQQEMGFSVYPNPIKQTAVVELQNRCHLVELEIFSLSGQLMYRQKDTETQMVDIQRSDLQPGVYLMKVTADKHLLGVKRLVVE